MLKEAAEKEKENKPPTPPEQEEQKTEKKMTSEELEEFLNRNKPKEKVYTNISDIQLWKKKNKIDNKTKIFIVDKSYHTIREALEERGWFENPDSTSNCFDFKFVIKGKDIDYSQL